MARKSISSVLSKVAPKKDEPVSGKKPSLFDRLNSTSPLDAEPSLGDLARKVASFPTKSDRTNATTLATTDDQSKTTTRAATGDQTQATTKTPTYTPSATPSSDRATTTTGTTTQPTTGATTLDRSNTTTVDRSPDRSEAPVVVHARSNDRSHVTTDAPSPSPAPPQKQPRTPPRKEASNGAKTTTKTTTDTITQPSTDATTALVIRGLSVQQRKILDHLLVAIQGGESTITKMIDIGEATDIPLDSIKRCLRQLEASGFLRRQKIVKGAFQGVEISLHAGMCSAYQASASVKMATPGRSPVVASVVGPEDVPEEASVVGKSPLLEERKKDLSICSRLRGISDEDFAIFWSDLAATGFGMHQVRQIIDKREAIGKTPEHVQQGLDHADAALRLGVLKGAKGESVQNPRAYIFAALVRDGSFPKPAGWVSPEEQARQEAEARLQALQEARRLQEEAAREQERQAQEAAFQAWRDGLTDDERQVALMGRMGPEDVWLRRVWRERTAQPEPTPAMSPTRS